MFGLERTIFFQINHTHSLSLSIPIPIPPSSSSSSPPTKKGHFNSSSIRTTPKLWILLFHSTTKLFYPDDIKSYQMGSVSLWDLSPLFTYKKDCRCEGGE
ncbi:hypothetical protein L1987_37640 [Smallanthus sonchifolius]|uniref:Uncharacterized protein n=1 Tax=Smallanthus sonchifolius TaxID=185202 RepID=A0ACB9HJG7_9ASTR|nr:hypothetical protein L1987_37640 [Smallanthus sonchifolius]